MSNKKVVTRFAPSPTGNLNLGGVRAGVFAYLFARHNNGEFIVRIEDTDRERSKKEYEENIFKSLAWLGLDIDATYRQSEHAARHEELLRKLVAEDKAYVSKEDPDPAEVGGSDPPKRSGVIRFRNPNEHVSFLDSVRGEISFDTTELKDFVIAKSYTEPLFHFAVVVDDWDEGITHVLRGEDHISNTPRQILLQEALGAPRPEYAHLPLVLNVGGSKLSKRMGAKPILEYRDMGYLPEAVFNYDAFLGWNPGGDKEIFTKNELIARFSLDRVQKSAATMDETKLLWFNQQHIKRLSIKEFTERIKDFMSRLNLAIPDTWEKVAPLMQDRAQTLVEAVELLKEYDFIDVVSYTPELLLNSGKIEKETALKHLKKISEILGKVSEQEFTAEKIKETVFPYATLEGRGAVLWPLRISLSGKIKSPDPFTISALIGKEKTLVQIQKAIKLLS